MSTLQYVKCTCTCMYTPCIKGNSWLVTIATESSDKHIIVYACIPIVIEYAVNRGVADKVFLHHWSFLKLKLDALCPSYYR